VLVLAGLEVLLDVLLPPDEVPSETVMEAEPLLK
jgi:hypothetical protein